MTSTKKRIFSDAELSAMVAEYEAGTSFAKIAARVGCAKNTVRRKLLETGVVPNLSRSQSRSMLGKPSPRKGKTHTAESRRKMSESARAKGVKPTLGKVYSEQERKNISDGLRRYYATRPRINKPPTTKRAERKIAHPRAAKEKLSRAEVAARKKIRAVCKQMIRRVLTMARKRKDASSEQLLGYTKPQLREHLERQFRPGMSWEARNTFHVDHIVPIAEFARRGVFDVAVINALGNLQVLTPEENQRKSDKLVYSKGLV